MTCSVRVWTFASLFPLAALSAGCGDDGGPGPDAESDPKCSADFGPTDPTALIDDLEDRDGALALAGDRNGSWWLSTDGTPGTVTPPPDAVTPPEKLLERRCGSAYAMRVTGQGFTTWGAVLSAGMRFTDRSESIDASRFRGIMFWARGGELNNGTIRVQLQDAQTFPEGGQCTNLSGDPDECYNGLGVSLEPFDTEWRLYKLPFEGMKQREGWGHRADRLDPSTVYTIEWNFAQNTVFDLTVDDVWFYE